MVSRYLIFCTSCPRCFFFCTASLIRKCFPLTHYFRFKLYIIFNKKRDIEFSNSCPVTFTLLFFPTLSSSCQPNYLLRLLFLYFYERKLEVWDEKKIGRLLTGLSMVPSSTGFWSPSWDDLYLVVCLLKPIT